MTPTSMSPSPTSPPPRRSNLRTALVLATIAAAFFAGVVLNHWLAAG